MAKHSAGLLMHRRVVHGGVEVFLVHPGGPFWATKDAGAWSIPKGEYVPGEEAAEDVARREFAEEIGVAAPAGPLVDLGSVRQRSGKEVRGFALEADLVVETVHSNTFRLEWPPRSGRFVDCPEVDRAEWCDGETARRRLVPAQVELLERLLALRG